MQCAYFNNFHCFRWVQCAWDLFDRLLYATLLCAIFFPTIFSLSLSLHLLSREARREKNSTHTQLNC